MSRNDPTGGAIMAYACPMPGDERRDPWQAPRFPFPPPVEPMPVMPWDSSLPARMLALEARLAAAEARIAQLEATQTTPANGDRE